MNKLALLETRTGHRFDVVLEEVAERIRLSLPAARCEIHHGQNEGFPWWVVARFSHGEIKEAKSVDVSIECQRRNEIFRLLADVARESGYVISEFPAFELTVAGDEEFTGSCLDEHLKRVEEFLLNQVPTIIQELT